LLVGASSLPLQRRLGRQCAGRLGSGFIRNALLGFVAILIVKQRLEIL
jgi:hypothetical protein